MGNYVGEGVVVVGDILVVQGWEVVKEGGQGGGGVGGGDEKCDRHCHC